MPLLAQENNHLLDHSCTAAAERGKDTSLKTGVVYIIAFSYDSDHHLGIDIFEHTC